MAATSNITLRGLIENLASGNLSLAPADLISANAPASSSYLSLANGDNTIAIPALAIGCLIVFDSTSTTVKKLKGIGADTGIVLSKTGWNLLSFTLAGAASFIINSSAADTGLYTQIIFF